MTYRIHRSSQLKKIASNAKFIALTGHFRRGVDSVDSGAFEMALGELLQQAHLCQRRTLKDIVPEEITRHDVGSQRLRGVVNQMAYCVTGVLIELAIASSVDVAATVVAMYLIN